MANIRDNDDNSEQRDLDQAQAVADDALARDDNGDALGSTKPDGGITDEDSGLPDTVDLMKQMHSSGRVDMGAFAGEPLMDDGDDVMPGTPAGPMRGENDDVMGGESVDAMDEIEDTGEDPLASVVSDDDAEAEADPR